MFVQDDPVSLTALHVTQAATVLLLVYQLPLDHAPRDGTVLAELPLTSRQTMATAHPAIVVSVTLNLPEENVNLENSVPLGPVHQLLVQLVGADTVYVFC